MESYSGDQLTTTLDKERCESHQVRTAHEALLRIFQKGSSEKTGKLENADPVRVVHHEMDSGDAYIFSLRHNKPRDVRDRAHVGEIERMDTTYVVLEQDGQVRLGCYEQDVSAEEEAGKRMSLLFDMKPDLSVADYERRLGHLKQEFIDIRQAKQASALETLSLESESTATTTQAKTLNMHLAYLISQ